MFTSDNDWQNLSAPFQPEFQIFPYCLLINITHFLVYIQLNTWAFLYNNNSYIASRDSDDECIYIHTYVSYITLYLHNVRDVIIFGHFAWCVGSERWSGLELEVRNRERKDYSHFILLYFKDLCAWNFIFIYETLMYEFICHVTWISAEVSLWWWPTNEWHEMKRQTDVRRRDFSAFCFVARCIMYSDKLCLRYRLKVWEKAGTWFEKIRLTCCIWCSI